MKVHGSKTRILLFLITIAAFVISNKTFAQSDTSSLSGTVTDSSGAVLPNATVVASNGATHMERTTQTNESGNYNITNLPAGNYSIRVEAANFQTTTLGNVHVDPSIGRRVDVSGRHRRRAQPRAVLERRRHSA